MFIYILKNTQNGKIYVGQTIKNPKVRIDYHLRLLRKGKHSNTYLQASFNKYGNQSFISEVIASARHYIELDELETFYINLFQTRDQKFGYNLKHGGRGGAMHELSKKKTSSSLKGRKMSEEARKNNSLSKMGHPVSAETRKKLSEANKGKKISEEAKRKISEFSRNRKMPEAAKRKISETLKGHSVSEETRKKISKKAKGRKHTPEAIRKIGEASAKRWAKRRMQSDIPT